MGLQRNPKKCMVMRIGDISRVDIKQQLNTHLGEMQFKEMEEEEFVYLGARVSHKFKEEMEIEARLSRRNTCVGSLIHLFRTKQLSRSAKLKIYKTIYAQPNGSKWMRILGNK